MEVNADGFVSFFNNLRNFFSSAYTRAETLFADNRLPKKPVVIVHAALSAFGHVPLGAATVLEALRLEARNRTMTLVMPAHSDCPKPAVNVPSENLPPEPVWFDRSMTPCAGMGAIANLFRLGKGVRRSTHPLLSFCAEGPLARRLLAGHRPETGLGPRSPAGKLARANALVLFLGVGYERCTLLHLAEYDRPDHPAIDRVTCRAIVPAGIPPFARARLVAWEDVSLNAEPFANIGAAFEAAFPEKVIKGSLPGGTGEYRLFLAKDLIRFSIDRSTGNGVL